MVFIKIVDISVSSPNAMAFSITGSNAPSGTASAGSVVGDATCVTDWISIPCATNTLSPTAQSATPVTVCVDRICGMVFNSQTSAAGSSSVPVNSKYHSNGILI